MWHVNFGNRLDLGPFGHGLYLACDQIQVIPWTWSFQLQPFLTCDQILIELWIWVFLVMALVHGAIEFWLHFGLDFF
jgi:hypothetical protein